MEISSLRSPVTKAGTQAQKGAVLGLQTCLLCLFAAFPNGSAPSRFRSGSSGAQASCGGAGLPAPAPATALSWQDSGILQLSGEGRRGLMSGGLQIVPTG
jgi:hypothetical protein